jgi:hypothetical protein
VIGPADPAEVDPVEQHRELRRVDLDGHRGRVHVRELERAALEPLIDEDEAALVPQEDLQPVLPSRDEDEEVAGVRVLRELVLDDREKSRRWTSACRSASSR